MGAQAAIHNRIHPHTHGQSCLESLLCPILDKLKKDASSKKHGQLIDECEVAIRWLSRPNTQQQHPQLLLTSVESEEIEALPSPGGSHFVGSPQYEQILQSDEQEQPTFRSPVKSSIDDPSTSNVEPATQLPGVSFEEDPLQDAHFVLSPLHTACRTSSPSLVETAIRGFQTMVSGGQICGSVNSAPRLSPSSSTIKKMVESLCLSARWTEDNPSLELALMEAIITVVASPNIVLHGDVLLALFRTSLLLSTRCQLVLHEVISKAVVAQTISVAFVRVERSVSTGYVTGIQFDPIMVDRLVSVVPRSAADVDFTQALLQKTVLGIVPETPGKPVNLTCIPHYENQSTLHVSDTTMSASLETCDGRYMKRSAQDGQDMLGLSASVSEFTAIRSSGEFDMEAVNDAFLLVQELCRRAMNSPYKGRDIDSVAFREKTLALETLCFVLEAGGAVLRGGFTRCLDLLRQTFGFCLVENLSSSLTSIFQLCCSICLRLLDKFRSIWKEEIGIFFRTLILRTLESTESSYAHKCITVCAVRNLCQNPQIFVDIFANYDCDMHEDSLFEGLLYAVMDTAEGKSMLISSMSPAQEVDLKSAAMACLSSILGSLESWVSKQMQMSEGIEVRLSMYLESDVDSLDAVSMSGKSESESGSFTPMKGDGIRESTEVVTFETRKALKKELKDGIALFNKKPRKGIASLIETKKIGESPHEIAHFLKGRPELNKEKIGEYLSEPEDDCKAILQAYVDLFHFEELDFDTAIRQFLSEFRLPRESQKIERVLEKFAERYTESNPHVFSSAVTAHVLAYSVIMLNTDAHNPAVRNKMTKEQFVRNNRGIDQGSDLPTELLNTLYDAIVNNEIRMHDVKHHSMPPGTNRMDRGGKKKTVNSAEMALWGRAHRKGPKSPLPAVGDILRVMQETFKSKGADLIYDDQYYSPSSYEIVRPMLESSITKKILPLVTKDWDKKMEDAVNEPILDSIKFCVGLTSRLGMSVQRDQFFVALNQFMMKTSKASSKTWKIGGRGTLTKKQATTLNYPRSSLDYQALTLKPQDSLSWCCGDKGTQWVT